MSKVATIMTSDLLPVLYDLDVITPRNASGIPVGFAICADSIRISYGTGVSYSTTIPATDTMPVTTTVLYISIGAFLKNSLQIELNLQSTGLYLISDEFKVGFELAYSTVEPINDIEYRKWINIPNIDHAIPGLRTITTTGLGIFYKKEKSVAVFGNISLLSYSNVMLQVRTTGLPFSAILPVEHCRLLVHFKPEAYCIEGQWLFFKKKRTLLILPYKAPAFTNCIPDRVRAMSEPITIAMVDYLGKVRAMSRLAYPRLTLVVYTEGFVTQASGKHAQLSIPAGNVNGPPLQSFIVPTDLWYLCLKVMKSDVFQMLYDEEGLICLRTQGETMLLRAIC